jgi:hypothetical protein
MVATRSRRCRRHRQGELIGTGCAVVLALLAVSGCVKTPRSQHVSTGPTTRTTSAALPVAGHDATATAPGGSGTPLACVETVGALLRERTTVTASNLVTVLAGTLPCAGIGLWAVTFTLDGDPVLDPAPSFGARYSGTRQLSVRLPAVTGRCAASAVFFAVDAPAAGDVGTAAETAMRIRSDLSSWPENSRGRVPGGAILQGHSSAVLAASVVGDPSQCSPGESVSTPFATAGDCWAAVPATGRATPPAPDGSATRFRRAACTAQHTHEVYWAESLTPRQYLDEAEPGRPGAAAWARRRAERTCAKRSGGIDLASDVVRTDVFVELLWPSTLSYPPSGTGWSKAQIICLARWKDGASSPRQILRR